MNIKKNKRRMLLSALSAVPGLLFSWPRVIRAKSNSQSSNANETTNGIREFIVPAEAIVSEHTFIDGKYNEVVFQSYQN